MLGKEKFQVGIPLIDRQHEELFCRVADFLLSLRQEGAWQEKLPRVKATMNFMQQYVMIHFADEESFQRQINYPHYEVHRKMHADFTDEVRRYAEILEREGYPEGLVQELGGKLLEWLIHHVAEADLKMAEHSGCIYHE